MLTRTLGGLWLLGAVACGAPTPAVDPNALTCPSTAADAGVGDVAPVGGGPYVVELAVGSLLYQCARMSDGTVRCRGDNRSGELGVGAGVDASDAPVTVPGLAEVEQVVTADLGSTTCTRHRDGTVRCWGSDAYHALGTGGLGDETCADGPCRHTPTLVPGLTDVVFIASGFFGTCAVRRGGDVWCWGDVPVIVPEMSASPVRSTRVDHAVALWPRNEGWLVRRDDGRYVSFGLSPDALPPSNAVLADGPSSGHICYRLPDASVRCAGEDSDGKLGDGRSTFPGSFVVPNNPGLCGVRSVATGAWDSCAVMNDGTVRCWGAGNDGALGTPAMERCAGIDAPSACATRPVAVAGLTGVDRVFLGTWGGCALRSDHSVACWGTLGDPAGNLVPVAW